MRKKYRYVYGKSADNEGVIQEKEVRKKMAIDYGKEWQKLRKSTGHCTVVKNNTGTTLNVIMDTQIRGTIDEREKLVQEYLRGRIKTEIVSQDKDFFKVAVTSDIKGRIDTIYISRAEFGKWLKNRKEVK